MSVVKIPQGTYIIESIANPGWVLDLQGGNPAAEFQWNLQYINEEEKIFTLQAASPSSNVFSPSVSQNTPIVGTPLQQLGLQVRATGGASVYQIIAPTQPGVQDLAFVSGSKEGDQVIFQVLIASNPAQQWRFKFQGAE